jgi:hypothetical protein
VISRPAIVLVTLVRFLGWGFLLVRFPAGSYRILAWGLRRPPPGQLKGIRAVGYMALGFGGLLLVENAWGLVPLR